MVVNPCADAAINNQIRVVARDAAGRQLGDDTSDTGAHLPVILPGQRLGVTALIRLSEHAGSVASLGIDLVSFDLVAPSLFMAWPKSATAEDLAYEVLDAAGDTRLTFHVRTDPPSAALCHPVAQVIVRDHAGRIVYGRAQPVDGSIVTVELRLPTGADRSKTEVYVVQGQYELGPNGRAEMACRA